MAKMCAITNDPDKDSPVYPYVDDKAELKTGDIVFVTATLVHKNKTTADYSLPGTIFNKGEGQLAVRLCPTTLWESGWEEIKEVMVRDADIRMVANAEDPDDDQLICTHWEDSIGEVSSSCVEDLMKEKNFKKWMGGATPNKTKREFLCAVIEKMGNSLTINEWQQRRPQSSDPVAKDTTFEKWIDSNYISPVIDEKTSNMTKEEEKTGYKKEVGNGIKTTAKYIAMLMDIMVGEHGPMAPKDPDTGEMNGGQDIKDILATVKDLAMKLETMQGSVNAMAVQLKVRDATNPPPDLTPAAGAGAKEVELVAKVVEVPGVQHECAYHVMSVVKAVNDGTTAPAGPPVFSNAAVDAAKKSTMVRARTAHEQDPKHTEAVLGFEIGKLYHQVLEKEQGEKTWAGEYHFVLHAPEHPEVELKLKTFRQGKLATMSTRQANLPPAKLVMFARWRPGHYEIIGVGTTEQASPKLAFSQDEAQAAEAAVDAFMRGGSVASMNELSEDEFAAIIDATLSANRAQQAPVSNKKNVANTPAKKVAWKNPSDDTGPPTGPLTPDTDVQAVTDASLATFAQEETVRQLQGQLEAQAKQMQAQAQLAMQVRMKLTSVESQLKTRGPQKAASSAAPLPAPTNPLDMILNGSAPVKPSLQTALVIWSNAGKKKIEQALKKVDAEAFKPIHSIIKTDGNTPNARHVVQAHAHNVPSVQALAIPLIAAGMRVDYTDTEPQPNTTTWTQVVSGNKRKGNKSALAGRAQAGLTTAIAKTGPAHKRVRGQCDYYGANTKCPRGATCHFACYNGPGKP